MNNQTGTGTGNMGTQTGGNMTDQTATGNMGTGNGMSNNGNVTGAQTGRGNMARRRQRKM